MDIIILLFTTCRVGKQRSTRLRRAECLPSVNKDKTLYPIGKSVIVSDQHRIYLLAQIRDLHISINASSLC
jgi:hypothetical protein